MARSCTLLDHEEGGDPDYCAITLYGGDSTTSTDNKEEEEAEDMFHPTFSGMVLQVFRNIANKKLGLQGDYESNHLPVRRGSVFPVNDHRHHYMIHDTFILEKVYQLLEPLHLELGIPPKHYLDYAYTPVVVVPPSMERVELNDKGNELPSYTKASPEKDNDNSVQELKDSLKAVVLEEDEATSSSWWKWWLPFTSNWWKAHGRTKSDYDMGGSAFAGGSHGEVWRGRRICRQNNRNGNNALDPLQDERHHGSDNDGNQEDQNCDDQQTLILKRLKVERGYRLLEAGLREVYFGSLLMKESSESLFTAYVDHFFREVSRPSSFGRRSSKNQKDLELWIVFQDAGPSLRSYLYTPVTTAGGFVMYQHSDLWTRLRMASSNKSKKRDVSVAMAARPHVPEGQKRGESQNSTEALRDQEDTSTPGVLSSTIGIQLLRDVLRQILTAAAFLHENGIVHRDIKPSNVMCKTDIDIRTIYSLEKYPYLRCVLGDFSSAWNNFTADHLYTNGPSPSEQTDEYAPPESYLGPTWVPFHETKPQSYDSWSIGVLALELLLGTPNVFTVDQRTTVLLTMKLKKEGASDEELQRALYLAALSHFCIYVPTAKADRQQSWPLRDGDPLHNAYMVKESCTLRDFHRALSARDPLGIGFDSSTDLLLHLIWQLLAWDPLDRITAAEALQHPFFTSPTDAKHPLDLIPGWHNALEPQILDPRMDFDLRDNVQEFVCPKCGRVFDDWRSCQMHAVSRKHAKFCTYDRSSLPTCINAHTMLPAHPTSGYCDLQGRRPIIEDFHSIHLNQSMQFYGVFDGHTGNLASKYVASTLYGKLSESLSDLNKMAKNDPNWKDAVATSVAHAFQDIHTKFLDAVALTPNDAMDQSGTTATALLITEEAVVVASLGDSRAILSSMKQDSGEFAAIQLTKDHVASDPEEKQKVISRGGFVSTTGGIDRVNGTLAITRSIGDANLAPLLSRIPLVVSMTRAEIRGQCGNYRLPCFVVLASDGLWDVMTNQEAVDMVVQVMESYDSKDWVSWNNGGAFQEAAEVLAVEAYVRGSTDNIGVCVVAVD